MFQRQWRFICKSISSIARERSSSHRQANFEDLVIVISKHAKENISYLFLMYIWMIFSISWMPRTSNIRVPSCIVRSAMILVRMKVRLRHARLFSPSGISSLLKNFLISNKKTLRSVALDPLLPKLSRKPDFVSMWKHPRLRLRL